MMNSKIKKTLIFLFIIDAGLFVLGSLTFWDIKTMNEQTSVFENEIIINTKREEALDSVVNMINDTKLSVAKLDTFFVGKDEALAGFIKLVESMAKGAGVNATVGSVSDEGVAKDLLRMKLTFNGPWQSVINFIGILESVPYKIETANLSINTITSFDNNEPLPQALSTKDVKVKLASKEKLWSGSVEFTVLKMKP